MFKSHLYGIEIVQMFLKRLHSRCLNRTFMELKFVLQCVYRLIRLRLNRTFMELKYRSYSGRAKSENV